jgi:outer membrane protein assembly factor BamB
MYIPLKYVVAFLCTTGLAAVIPASDNPHDNWPAWRGPHATGAVAKGDPPLEWGEKSNVKWKTPIPGKGSATPIVWGDRVFITTAIDTGRKAKPQDIPKPDPKYTIKTEPPDTYWQYIVLCLDRATGKELWKRVAAEEVPHEGIQPTHSNAAGSPVTDGKRLYVSFGSRGVYCYDLDGNLKWLKRLGVMHTRYAWGEASTPALYRDWLIVPWDHEGPSELYVLDADTGNVRWRAKRDEPTGWSTPVVAEHNGQVQVIVNATNKVRGYDLKSGDVLWECGGMTVNAIPSPVVRDGIAYVMSGYRGAKAVAVPLDARGDVTGTKKVLWELSRNTPYVPSPLLLGDRLYFTQTNTPILSCVDIKTGREVYRERLPGLATLYASPVGVNGRIYITDRRGTTLVLKAGDRFEVLATNQLDTEIDGSPAVAGRQMFLRSHSHVYCLENQK